MMDQLKEHFLHFVWQYQLFDHSKLETTYNQTIEILSKGHYNHNQGADFLNAKIKIGTEILIGHIEIHKRNEEWYQHKHQKDPKYSNTILHVVYKNTEEIYTLTHSNSRVPILCLENYISKSLLDQLTLLVNNHSDIACTNFRIKPDNIQLKSFKNKLILERIIKKAEWIKELIQTNNNDTEKSFYEVMLYGFGLKVNANYFLEIAKNTPIQVLARYRNKLESLEAILLGQANLLSSTPDTYSKLLQEEYNHISQLHHLHPINTSPLFSKMMPASFPSIRLVQFASLICDQHGLYSKMIHAQSLSELKNYFNVKASTYWETHYIIGKETGVHSTAISTSFFHKIVINVLLPFYLIYDERRGVNFDRIIDILEHMPSEENKITKKMCTELNIENKTALDSQSIIQWHNEYCVPKRCLACPVGFKLFSTTTNQNEPSHT